MLNKLILAFWFRWLNHCWYDRVMWGIVALNLVMIQMLAVHYIIYIIQEIL